MRAILYMSLLVVLFAGGCASTDAKIYSENEIKQIPSWEIGFSYESGSVEATKKVTGNDELKVISTGQSSTDLQLRDDLYFILKDDHSIPVTKTPSDSSGKLLLHTIHFRSGGFKSLTVNIVNNKGDTVGRLKITNGDRNATYMDENDFTEYAASAIAQALIGKPK